MAGPNLSEIRLDGVAYGPRGRRESFRGSYHLRDGVGVSGPGFAMWSLSWRGKVVPRHPLGDGGRFRARKISQKTYEIFFMVSRAVRRVTPNGHHPWSLHQGSAECREKVLGVESGVDGWGRHM